MAIIKCKMCGGDLNVAGDSQIAVCEYCGTQQTVPKQDNEKKLTLFARANRLRFSCEFDKAADVYESIVAEFPEEPEAYWDWCSANTALNTLTIRLRVKRFRPAIGRALTVCSKMQTLSWSWNILM